MTALFDHRYFSAIPTRELLNMAKKTVSRNVSAGDDVVRQGEAGDEFFILREGSAEILVDDVSTARAVRLAV